MSETDKGFTIKKWLKAKKTSFNDLFKNKWKYLLKKVY